jgi:hypothetical protein
MTRAALARSSSVACLPAQFCNACVRRGSVLPEDRHCGKLPVLTGTNLVGAHTEISAWGHALSPMESASFTSALFKHGLPCRSRTWH